MIIRLRIFLGKINNFDQTFLNGELIGVNNRLTRQAPVDADFIRSDKTLYSQERCYVLPFDDPRIHWDGENVIAVRVYDEGGQGGLYTGDQEVRPVLFRDYVTLEPFRHPFTFAGKEVKKTVVVGNTAAAHRFRGALLLSARGKMSGRLLWRRRIPIDLAPGGSQPVSLRLEKATESALLEYRVSCPQTGEEWTRSEESPYILTPPPPAAPRINGAEVYGARPGRPFLYLIPASGERPMRFSAADLPAGLSLDPETGVVRGRVERAGEYEVTLTVANRLGQDSRRLRLKIGDAIALTPPMGWNSWNCWGLSVDTEKTVASARVFKEKGLADHGWSYINIDDGWEIFGDDPRLKRDAQGVILTNEKFPDMKSLGDRLHDMGLKFGIYSSPGPLTCGGYTGSWQHEESDARTFAAWGVDYLKYDWCSYDRIAPQRTPDELREPYRVMRRALDAAGRDIVYSLCQYGMGKVWEWGAEVGGNLWRTTEDIEDTWKSMSTIGFAQTENAPFAGPGRWNDPDMLVVGWVGWGPNLHPSRLTPDEQYTHISLWCLLSAPLLIGCDLERLDPFTINLLQNDEVLALDQDALGRQAVRKLQSGAVQVWVKELADGRHAVGLFNLGEHTTRFTLDFTAAGLPTRAALRDLWRQQDLGRFTTSYTTAIPSHGVVLLKMGTPI